MSGIGKAFSGQKVLDGVRFDLRAGEVHILAGENGAGKSTLIKILAGVHTEHTGTIEYLGKTVRFHSPQDAARRGISVIHQELSLIPHMTVADNIFLGREQAARGGWMRFGDQERACRGILQRLQLDISPKRLVGEFPISVQQTIEIAKALAFEARVIVMDEPTSSLTDPEVERLFGVIDDLKRQGCGIVYISHKMEEIYRVADRITVLRDGKYIGTSAAAELPRKELIRWMVGRDMEEQFPRHRPEPGPVRLEVRGFTVPDPEGRPRPAVDKVTFEARRGEILGIGGLQGSGASELLQGLFGVYGGTVSGQVLVDGEPCAPVSPSRSIARGVALLTNDRKSTGLVLGMPVAQNITLASLRRFSPGGWLREGAEARCAEAHRDRFGIRAATLAQPVETLSGGNQQKVALAKWLETGPRVLLLDEPTRGVDIGAKHDIYTLMNNWTREGITILLITSEMPELLAMSDRIMVMHQGKITGMFDRDGAAQEKILAAAMGRAGGVEG